MELQIANNYANKSFPAIRGKMFCVPIPFLWSQFQVIQYCRELILKSRVIFRVKPDD